MKHQEGASRATGLIPQVGLANFRIEILGLIYQPAFSVMQTVIYQREIYYK